MKKVYILFLILWGSILLTSCDLETNPTTSVEAGQVFATTSDADKVLIGSWSYLMETFNSYANPGFGAMLRANDAMGSDVVLNTRYGFSSHYAFTALYGKGGTNSLSWVLAYKTINNANAVISNIGLAKGTESEKNRIAGQAYALRGFMYLHLASSYSFAIDKDPNALCAPIYTEPSTANTLGKPAATVSQVYTQAIDDLEIALKLIPENYQRNSKYKIDTSVTLGLLSRASLYARDWQRAKKYSDQLLLLNNYLMSEVEYNSGFNDVSNGEWIWGHPQTNNQNNASYLFHFLDTTSEQSYYYSFNVDPYFRDLFNDGDYRKDMIYWATDPGKDPQKESFVWMRFSKFKFKAGDIADIVLMRTSEIYLINAEAKAQLQDPNALVVLNELKSARGAQEVQGLSGQVLINAIWEERRKELFGEGFALIDIIRNQQAVVRKDFPQSPKVNYNYTDDQGQSQSVSLTPQGHRVFVFPDQSPFTANSPYYLYRIPNSEELTNDNLYN